MNLNSKIVFFNYLWIFVENKVFILIFIELNKNKIWKLPLRYHMDTLPGFN